jgi:hypothetical protein
MSFVMMLVHGGSAEADTDRSWELLLLARYFARRVTTIAINANAAKTTAAIPIFFICSHLPKD